MSWKGTVVRHRDGREGVICEDYEGFLHRALSIRATDGSNGRVQLNANSRDSGDEGWQWLCVNFAGGRSWLPLGDNSGCEIEPYVPSTTPDGKEVRS